MPTASPDEIRIAVQDRYAAAARTAADGQPAGDQEFTRTLYPTSQLDELPDGAVAASLGCGNPTMLADLQPGQTVLDLGSGGGIDVLLSARRVGPDGTAYGLDMTDEMLDLARRNQREAGVENAEFLRGAIERIPLPDATVDVIISNCVINLSADKDAVFREALRVLRPGGRLAISDILLTHPIPPEARGVMALWTGCVAGALTVDEYRDKLRAAGFDAVSIEPVQVFDRAAVAAVTDDLRSTTPVTDQAIVDSALDALAGNVMSAFVRGHNPAR